MKDNEQIAVGWLIGYFVLISPYIYAIDGSLIKGLWSGIFGVTIALIFLIFGGKDGKS